MVKIFIDYAKIINLLLFLYTNQELLYSMLAIKKNRLSRTEISSIRQAGGDLLKTIRDTQTLAREATEPTDLKHKALALVNKYRKDINEEDLPKIQSQLKAFFDSQPVQPYCLRMDLDEAPEDQRIVIIGDTHCDFNSLAGIIEKLSLSSYDYFEKARFIFLGDYLDRGKTLFEYIMLLVGLKKMLGERCIFLKGNHELIEMEDGQIVSMVFPADTAPTLNAYCGADQEFLRKFTDYFSGLPVYLVLKSAHGTDLLVHGGIPRDRLLDKLSLDPVTGEILAEASVREQALQNMIWADPRTDRFKLQGGGSRFEFGREQFLRFADANGIGRLFRSHEPVRNGVESFYDGRLYTVFSNGGGHNPLTYYQYVDNPVFCLMDRSGEVRFESVLLKRVQVRKGLTVLDTVLEMGQEPASLRLEDLHLNPEFYIINQ